MPERPDVTYIYDGSFEGLMCCVFESYGRRETPGAVYGPGTRQLSLFGGREIATDRAISLRVSDAIPRKICPDALDFVQRAFLTFHAGKELDTLLFLRLGFTHGRKVMDMLHNDVVDRLSKAVRHLGQEAHLLSGFLRFSDAGGALVAQITPKNFVLPVLAPHFIARYPGENMLIYDKTHRSAFFCHEGKIKICPVEDFTMPGPDEEELRFRKLWKLFYNTIGIKERYNPKCRMTHMPKRYWENMTEFN
jgi:probable DNA metabolism protein